MLTCEKYWRTAGLIFILLRFKILAVVVFTILTLVSQHYLKCKQNFLKNFFHSAKIKMATFRKTRECLLTGYSEDLIDEEEFFLLYDIKTSKNLDFQYWTYEYFQLDKLTDDECSAEFRFWKNDIFELADVLNIPEEITTYNRVKVDGIELYAYFLKDLHTLVDTVT